MDAEMGEFLRKRCAWILKIKTKMQKVLVPRLNPTFWFRAAVTGDSSPSHCAARPFRTTDQQLARQGSNSGARPNPPQKTGRHQIQRQPVPFDGTCP